MTIMEPEKGKKDDVVEEKIDAHEEPESVSDGSAGSDTEDGNPDNDDMFAGDNLMKDTEVVPEGIDITPEDKIRFIDSLVGNSRYTRDYSMFGGKVKLTLRSLTSDEVNALSAWSIKAGSSDSAGLMAGRYRKYMAAAQVAMMNGVEMPPLDEPLFETIGKDGKTVSEPGWVKRCDYWDGMSVGLFESVMKCIKDFDGRYSVLCKKAEDANFWDPDTH